MRDPRWDNAGTRRRSHAQLQTTEEEGWSEQVEKAQGHEVINRSTADRTRVPSGVDPSRKDWQINQTDNCLRFNAGSQSYAGPQEIMAGD